MVQAKNIIKKMHVEIETSSLEDAFHLKDTIDTFFRTEIYPEIDKILQELQISLNENTVRFDTIPLEINISKKELLKDLKSLILNQLKNKINISNSGYKPIESRLSPPQEKSINAFAYYLENGQYPWWFSFEKTIDKTAIKHFVKDPNFVLKIRPILGNINVQKRLVFQLENELLISLLSSVSTSKKSAKLSPKDLSIIKDIRYNFWHIIFDQIVNRNKVLFIQKIEVLALHISKATEGKKITSKIFKKRMVPLIHLFNLMDLAPIAFNSHKSNHIGIKISESKSVTQTIASNQMLVKEIKDDEITLKICNNPVVERKLDYLNLPKDTDTLDNGTLVNNAGLVLLHPFLKQFFTNMGFLSSKNKLLEAAFPEALGVLHFLATKRENPEEHELVCEKFLCGIPIQKAIIPRLELSEKQKEACTELLHAVLSHWTALKTNNIDALRSEFLMREGKISKKAKKDKVFVQRKTQDILLEKLPWNLSLMKLPWKENMVMLEW